MEQKTSKSAKKRMVNMKNNKILIYIGIVLVATLAFIGVYMYTDGDLSKLAGAAISCGDKTAAPVIEITNTEEKNGNIILTVKATDDCGLDRVEAFENIYEVQDDQLVPNLILGNIDEIENDETAFEKVYVFAKDNYELKGGKVKYEFTAYDISGEKTTANTENFDI